MINSNPRRAAAAAAAAVITLIGGCSTANQDQPDHGQQEQSPTAPAATAQPSQSAAPSPTARRTGPLHTDPSGGPGSASAVTPGSNPEQATATASRAPLPAGKKGTPRGAKSSLPGTVDRAEPDDVALAFAMNLELWDSKIDNRPNDAAARAAAYATKSLRKKMLDGAPVAPPGNDWNTLAGHDGYTTVKAELGGIGQPPPDTKTIAWRAVTITAHTMRGNAGWSQAGPSKGNLYILELRRSGSNWTVASYQLQ